MASTRLDVDRWIKSAKEQGKKFIISVCDTFEYDDYPVFCENEKEMKEEHKYYKSASMQKINEIIHIKDEEVIENLTIHDF